MQVLIGRKRASVGKGGGGTREFKETFVGKDLAEADRMEAEGELGDLIFSLVNFARFIDLNPETAVERTNRKFIKRFQHLEKRAAEIGKALSEMTLAEMDVYWEEAKNYKRF